MSAKQLARAVEAGDLVEAMRGYGVSQADIAQVAKVDPKTVYAWRAVGARPRGQTYERLDGLREVVRILSAPFAKEQAGTDVGREHRGCRSQEPRSSQAESQGVEHHRCRRMLAVRPRLRRRDGRLLAAAQVVGDQLGVVARVPGVQEVAEGALPTMRTNCARVLDGLVTER